MFVQGKISWNKLREHRFSVLDLVIAPPRVFVFLHRRQKTEIKTGSAIGNLVIRSSIFDRICQFFADALSTQATPSQGHPTTIFGKYLFGRRFEN